MSWKILSLNLIQNMFENLECIIMIKWNESKKLIQISTSKNSLVYLDNNTFSSFKHIYISDYKCLLQQSIYDGIWDN